MKSRIQKRPGKRQLYFLNDHGMVTCNHRDREAAHRTEMESIATGKLEAVTCKKCWDVISKTRELRHKEK